MPSGNKYNIAYTSMGLHAEMHYLHCMQIAWIVVLDLFTHNVDVLFTDNLACLVWVMIFNTGHLVSLDIRNSVGGCFLLKFLCRYNQVAKKIRINVFVSST